MYKLLNEVLSEINADPALLSSVYKFTTTDSPLALVFKHAYLPRWKFLLPEGEPPYNKEEGPEGMNTSNMLSETKRFKHLCNGKIKQSSREDVFISMLEAVHPSEALVLLAIKDQQLHHMYPKLTIATLIATGYLPPLPDNTTVADFTPKKIRQPKTKSAFI